jgi:NAD(P)-dependent dehydrogenase (short-subunit alcohol dehydrogenase family)
MNSFSLKNKIVVITGGCGLLGIQYAKAIMEAGGQPILLDIYDDEIMEQIIYKLNKKNTRNIAVGFYCDITKENDIRKINKILNGETDILINNACLNPIIKTNKNRLETFTLENWEKNINVGLTGAFLCSKVFGTEMAKNKKGVIINISSDLGLIAPNQSIYRKENLKDSEQPVKPVTYSVIKHGIIGLTRYLATYWANDGIRCNALCIGGVYNNQDPVFVKKLSNLIPMNRMAKKDEYKASIVYLCSDASSYMTGSVLTVDGGRTCW